MAAQVYKTLAKIVGIILILVGAVAIYAGNFTGGFIKSQLEDQAVVLPTEEAIDAQLESGRIQQDDADALRPVAGEAVTTGKQAEIFANHYIQAHMKAAVAGAGLPEDTTFATVGGITGEKTNELAEEVAADNPDADEATVAKLVQVEINDPLTDYPLAEEVAALDDLRYSTLLDGNTLRGMLLNAYGWGMVGTIATWAGIGAIIVGIALTAFGFMYKGRREEEAVRVDRA